MLSACLQLSTSTTKLLFLVFFSFRSSLCRNNFFYEERWEFGKANLLQRFNNNESGEVCCFILWVWFWQVLCSFFIWRHHRYCIFFACPVLHHPPQSPTCVFKRETYSPWLRWEYMTSILKLRVGFWAIANFRFSALVKFLFSQCNWPLATAF